MADAVFASNVSNVAAEDVVPRTKIGEILDMRAKKLELQKAKELYPYQIEAGKAQSQSAQTAANTAQLQNIQAHQQNASREMLKVLNQKEVTPDDLKNMVTQIVTNAGGGEQAVQQALRGLPQQGSTADLKAFVAQHALNSLTAESQFEKLFPKQQLITNAAGQMVTAQYTPTGQVSIAPTQEVGVPQGAQMPTQGAPAAPGAPQMPGMMPPQQAPAQTLNPSQAQATFAGQGAQVAGQDWASTYDAAKIAPQRIAVFQNIKKLVPESYTGALAEKKQIAANLAQSIGIDYKVLESSSTDELAKNTKLLQLAGGNTDAARQIAELANPNTKMTKEGINRVVDQLIGIEKMNVARANYLGPFSSNQAEYSRRSAAFNQVADPRLFQEMTPQEVAKLKASLSPAQQLELTNKIRAAKQMGIIQ